MDGLHHHSTRRMVRIFHLSREQQEYKNTKITQACLQKMQLADGTYRWQVPRPWPMRENRISVKLPPGLRCSQCVIQWKWHCGNNWGCDKSGCGMGHGQQEEFYGCADVAIV